MDEWTFLLTVSIFVRLLVTSSPNLHVSGLGEEAGVPKGNPQTQGDHADSTQDRLAVRQ